MAPTKQQVACKRFAWAKLFPGMMANHTPLGDRYFKIFKAVIKKQIPRLPEKFVVLPVTTYAHLIKPFGKVPAYLAPVAIPVNATSYIEDGALIVEYTDIIVLWFTKQGTRKTFHTLPTMQRNKSRTAARARAAEFLADLAGV